MRLVLNRSRARREFVRRRPTTRVRRAKAAQSEPAKVEAMPKFIAVDFFCGAGGTTRGLIDAGGYVVAGIDKELRCKRTYVENNSNEYGDREPPLFLARDVFPRTDAYPAGEQTELAAELAQGIEAARRRFPGVPLLFAICAPCQPFTTLSRNAMSDRRLEKRDRDSNLLCAALAFVAEHDPEFVLSENVAGISDPRFGGIWAEFRRDLGKLGFVTGSRTVCVSRFGVPQFRKRSILLASKRDLTAASHLADLLRGELLVPEGDPDAPAVDVQSAIGHLPPLGAGETHATIPNHRTRSLSELNLKRIGVAKPGETNRYMVDTVHGDLSLACHQRIRAKGGGFNDVYGRMRPDSPSPTITTRCHSISNGRFGHYDVKQLRGISLREAAALQSFGDDYVFHPTNMIEPVARMIGNAVPPRLARFFADYLVGSLAR
ncbi:DNA cytosine methyltransferase [Sphingomonas sp. GC_Shp_5]|uniref:DNA cytosine methyltransferase n=2 Tax=unclassified Sphingomonas TaxID=196159 RepID=UPI00226AA2B8|nr:DNA cytosine methyltransferase [Sphingomonas sp. GC_Shp_5]